MAKRRKHAYTLFGPAERHTRHHTGRAGVPNVRMYPLDKPLIPVKHGWSIKGSTKYILPLGPLMPKHRRTRRHDRARHLLGRLGL